MKSSHTFPLERWQEAFALAERGEESIKVVLTRDKRG
jgi:threonine dehydrogenase-like Zn-dependent dehydrogenase